MLSFTRHSQSKFEGADTVPAAALRSRPAVSFQVKSNRPIPSGAKRREADLKSRAVDYLCRWSVVMPNDLRFDDAEAEESAFYAAICEADLEQRARSLGDAASADVNTGDANVLLEQMRAHRMLTPHNCCTAALLHDWSCDLSSKKVFDVNQRSRIVVHYAHPCNKYGREVKSLTSEEAERRGEKPVEQRMPTALDGAPARSPVVNALMSELMAKHSTLRSKKPSDEVAKKIEQTCAEREQQRERAAEEAQLERQKQVAQAQREYVAACDKMLAKATLAAHHPSIAAKMHPNDFSAGELPAALQNNTASSSSEVCGEAMSSSSSSSSYESEGSSDCTDSDSSSATFSDEKPLKPRTYAEVVRSMAPTLPLSADDAPESSGTESSDDDCQPDPPQLPADDDDAESDVESDNDVQKESVTNGQDDENENESAADVSESAEANAAVAAPKGFAIRQTSFEAMVPICESDDTLATFDKMECEYVLQWAEQRPDAPAGAPRSKIHLFRRQTVVESAYFGLSSTTKSVYHLIVSIEIV